MLPDVRLLEMRFHRSSDRASNPFVKIAKYNSRAFELGVIDDSGIE